MGLVFKEALEVEEGEVMLRELGGVAAVSEWVVEGLVGCVG